MKNSIWSVTDTFSLFWSYLPQFTTFCHINMVFIVFGKNLQRNSVFDQILGSILYLIFFWKEYFKQLAICPWLANLICATINQRRSFLNQILVRQNCTLEKLNHGNIKYIESNTPRRAPLVKIQDLLDWKVDSFYLLSILVLQNWIIFHQVVDLGRWKSHHYLHRKSFLVRQLIPNQRMY